MLYAVNIERLSNESGDIKEVYSGRSLGRMRDCRDEMTHVGRVCCVRSQPFHVTTFDADGNVSRVIVAKRIEIGSAKVFEVMPQPQYDPRDDDYDIDPR